MASENRAGYSAKVVEVRFCTNKYDFPKIINSPTNSAHPKINMDHSVHDVDNDLILNEQELRTGRHQGAKLSWFDGACET